MISKKHCLFCTELVAAERDGEYVTYYGCMCAPQGNYRLKIDAYSAIAAFPHEYKRRLLPILSAHVRELDEQGERATLTLEQAEAIMSAPEVPMTADQKERRLLRYVYQKSEAPGDPVNLHPLSRSYNVAYASNLQELVYLIEKARDAGWLIREGAVLRLTDEGWAEAAAVSGGERRKECCVLPGSEDMYAMWIADVPAGLEQCGYRPRLLQPEKLRRMEDGTSAAIVSSKLLIVDISDAGPETYYAAGFAASAGVPVLWTVHSAVAERHADLSQWLRPMPWDNTAQLIERLRERIS